MSLTSAVDYANIVSSILGALSLLFGAFIFFISTKRERIKQTLEYWEQINSELKIEKKRLIKDYGKIISSEMAQLILEDDEEQRRLHKVINIYERLALGVNIGAYDIDTLNRLVGQNIIDNYTRFAEYISARRIKFSRKFAWKEFEQLRNTLVKLRANN